MKRLILLIFISFFFILQTANADSVTDNALSFLKSKQDANGKITTGFSAPSEWSAIAFAINGIDIATVKSSEKSLKDFLLTDIPSEPSSATDWENRILAIVAIGEDPTNFGGVNYVQKLESFHKDGQIGDSCSLNDDVFGLLALVASGNVSTTQIKQDILNFLVQKQDPQDGGFGFSAPGCEWYSTASDMTAAALQSLQAAKENGLINPFLDETIEKAKNYLLTNQVSDGGFGYFGSSDSDTTGWVLMAFNVLGLKDSEEALKTRNWLLTQQSIQDGGFQAFDYGTNSMVSNATTTAQTLIALSGKGWITKIFTPSVSASPSPATTPSPIPTVSPSPTHAPISSVNTTPTPSPTPTLSSTPPPSPSPTHLLKIQVIKTPTPQVLGEASNESEQAPFSQNLESKLELSPTPKPTLVDGFKSTALPMIGIVGLFATFKFLEGRRWRE